MADRITSRCCGEQCFREGVYPEQPCWGDVTAIEEIPSDDGGVWIHACEGHHNSWDDSNAYTPPPKVD